MSDKWWKDHIVTSHVNSICGCIVLVFLLAVYVALGSYFSCHFLVEDVQIEINFFIPSELILLKIVAGSCIQFGRLSAFFFFTMAVACASRFAVLKLEDDDIVEEVSSEKTNQTKSKTSAKSAAASESKTKSKKKKKPSSDVAELQSLAFGSGISKSKNKNTNHSTNHPKGATSAKQWEEWKKKDNEFVSETYEQDLQEALLLSKIDYEEKKDIYDAIQKSEEINKNCTNAQKKKKKNTQKKEKNIMSLDEFQNLSSSQAEGGSRGKIDALEDFSSPEKLAPIDESDFFDKIEEDAERIINREQRQDMYKKMEPVEHSARRLQFEDEMEKKNKQIRVLSQEVTKLKEELKDVKARNKRLCSILAEGEMREKAEILIQIEQLTNVKDELTDQLNEFHVALEQERSKVHALQTELKKCQSNKKDRRDSK